MNATTILAETNDGATNMLTTIKEAEDRKLGHIDPRIRKVLLSVSTNGDRGALRAVLQIVGKITRPEKREKVCEHFESRIKPHLRAAVKRLHVAYRIVAAEEQSKASDFDQWLEDAKRRAG